MYGNRQDALIVRKSALDIGKRSARLTGLQQFKAMADAVGCGDGDVHEAARFLGIEFRTRINQNAFNDSGHRIDIGFELCTKQGPTCSA